MARRTRELFATIHTEGGLLPPELLKRIAEGDRELPGLAPEAYHLEKTERIGEAINRAWNRLRGAWEAFREARAKLGEGAPDAGLTRDRWLLVLFQELGYGRLPAARGIEIDGGRYPVSHVWHHTPIHLVGYRTELDRRTPGVAGAARRSPHSLVQELLNRSVEHQWGFLSNGLRLRLLRDNASLTRQAFIEFDLEAMLEGEVYADFALLFLLCHQSRVEAEQPDSCWLEQWVAAARDQGTRALEHLRGGVQAAIEVLGHGFLAHPKNGALREALRAGTLDKQEYYRELLRLVYRLLFLLVAEDRDLLLDPDAKIDAKRRYLDHYSTARLRRLASRRRGGLHPDLWRSLRLVMAKLGDDAGCPDLALPALGSFLWSSKAVPHLADAELANEYLLAALRALAFTEQERLLRPVDWRNLDTEELGSVYESLLELHPEVDAGAPTFSLSTAAGHERKTTGSYYTPDSLVQCLLDTALDPVLAEAAKKPEPEAALLALTVCDPACGSGHFLIAAARRMARRLAQVRTGDAEPDPAALQHALRDVIGKCVYGVDVNPMAVELCKVSLWLEAIEPGRPLSFLDHQIQCGNSLLGTTPALLAKGIPDDAFEPIEGDDKKVASALRKRNKAERKATQQETMFAAFVRDGGAKYWSLSDQAASIHGLADDTISALHHKEAAFARLSASTAYAQERLFADAWCAAFVWSKAMGAPDAPTNEVFRRLGEDPAKVLATTRAEVERLAAEYRFFHWHLAFPEVFRTGKEAQVDEIASSWNGGFDVVLSNPPWERTSFEEIAFFEAARNTEIARAATTSDRRRLIAELGKTKDPLYFEYLQARRSSAAEQLLVTASGRFLLTAVARTDTYALFADLSVSLVGPSGRAGLIVPTGIATSIPLQGFWNSLFKRGRVRSLSDFENRAQYFPGVDSRKKFCLLTVGGSGSVFSETQFGFFIPEATALAISGSSFPIAPADMERVNPLTGQPPVVRSLRDLQLLVHIHRHATSNRDFTPGWVGYTSAGTGDSWVPARDVPGVGSAGNRNLTGLIEGKMVHQFDHRFATYHGCSQDAIDNGQPIPSQDRRSDPEFLAQPRFYVPREEAEKFKSRKTGYAVVIPVYRDYTSASNERTLIATLLASGVPMQPLNGFSCTSAIDALLAVARLNSLVIDYIARLKTPDIHLNVTIFNQLPGPPIALSHSNSRDWQEFLTKRSLELIFTSKDMAAFADDCGLGDPPFRFDEERRFLLRCELDAAFFHLYLPTEKGDWQPADDETLEELARLRTGFRTPRDAVAYILDTFPIVRRKDEEAYGEYRTKRVILEIYDALQQATDTGEPYATRLDPPPAAPRVAHPPRRGA